jgi:hypothetical protein
VVWGPCPHQLPVSATTCTNKRVLDRQIVDSSLSLCAFEGDNVFKLTVVYCDVSSKSVALGGTHEKGDWTTTIDPVHRQRIWQGCCRLIPSLEVNWCVIYTGVLMNFLITAKLGDAVDVPSDSCLCTMTS